MGAWYHSHFKEKESEPLIVIDQPKLGTQKSEKAETQTSLLQIQGSSGIFLLVTKLTAL